MRLTLLAILVSGCALAIDFASAQVRSAPTPKVGGAGAIGGSAGGSLSGSLGGTLSAPNLTGSNLGAAPVPNLGVPAAPQAATPFTATPTNVQCVPHWHLDLGECSTVEEIVHGLGMEAVKEQQRRDEYADDPDSAPDPACVRRERRYISCP